MKYPALILATAIAGTFVFLGAKHSTFLETYTCEGYRSSGGTLAEPDQGRLEIAHPAFWLRWWNAKSDGTAVFHSTEASIFETDFRRSGQGNLTVYTGISPAKTFTFKWASDELYIQDGRMMFLGSCIAVL